MAERCQICKFDSQVSSSICLKCHKIVCHYCSYKHFDEGNDHIPGFKKNFLNMCHLHKLYLDVYCQECDEVVCSKCVIRNHKKHKHDNLDKIASSLAISKFPAVKKNLEGSEKAVQILESKISKSQKSWDSFLKEVLSVESLLDNQYQQIAGLFFRKKCEVNDIVNGVHTDVAVFLEQRRHLKLARTIEHEKKKTLSEAMDVMIRYKNSKEFVLRYLQFRKDVQNCVTNPQPVGDEIPTLKLNCDQHSISEIEDVLPHIWFGMLKKTLFLISENSKYFRAKCELTPFEPIALNFQRPSTLTNYKDTERIVSEYETSTEAVLMAINEMRSDARTRTNIGGSAESSTENEEHFKRTIQEKEQELEMTKNKLQGLQERVQNIQRDNANKQKQLEMKWKDCEDLNTRVQNLEKDNDDIQKQFEMKWKESEDFKTRIKYMERDNATTVKQLDLKLKECEDLKTRLSQVAGAKLVAGNTSIADLGDRYRPTRIAELFSELYDNEWTEAVDTLCDAQCSEEKIVQNLFITLQGCYETCCQLANLQMQELVQRLFLDLSSTDVSQYVQAHTTELKQLRDARKSIACDVANVICEDFHNNKTFIDYIRSCSWSDADIVHQITKQKFFEKCITLCWLMVVQDPEMYLDGDVKRGTKFDKDRYREYTKSGPLFLCSIWPALYLHQNGPLMIKGVAQACG